MSWTDAAIPNLAGRRAIVTGANSGIGYWIALQLAAHGATVVLACRNMERGDDARRRLRDLVPRADAAVAPLDLADLQSVRAFVETELARDGGLDLLVNNAGLGWMPRTTTKDGFELQLGTNHLGHFALTGRLLPRLLLRPDARVVTVGSGSARGARIDFDDLQSERTYGRGRAYGRSKLANLLFATELARRAEASSTSLRSVAAHPGFAATNIAAGAVGPRWLQALAVAVTAWFGQPAEQGAWPILYAATSEAARNGGYYGPQGRGGGRGEPGPCPLPREALDVEAAARLWTLSEELTGVHLELPAADSQRKA
ncbi:MAG: oxidoreductase [Candidatus Dormiibacterota bacterium]